MAGQSSRGRKAQFKDYCLILQVHPEADGAMIDAAYWHLAKRYNQAGPNDPHARRKLEELNEAYNVLGSADRREEYMKTRAAVLGEGALPVPPPPVSSKPPLQMMQRLRPKAREPLPHTEETPTLWRLGAVSSTLAVPFATLAVVTFLAGTSHVIVAGLFLIALFFAVAPLGPILVRLPNSAARRLPLPRLRLPGLRRSNRFGRGASSAPPPIHLLRPEPAGQREPAPTQNTPVAQEYDAPAPSDPGD